ncbi:MAG: PKD domain-containing protein [Candidatus Methanofastidiosa archaeon]|nr:PKD domain-containing protein [Candidatus Methanofastidiosa archaeon]
MTEILSGDALTRWRTHPQRVRGFVGIWEPERLVRRRINQVGFTYPVAQLTFDNPDADPGDTGDLEPGMLIVFRDGTSEAMKGYGRVRKAVSGATLYIAPTGRGDVEFANDDIIDVYDMFVPWSHIPYISPAGVIYKDYDVAYSGQTDDFPPVANAGPARARFVSAAPASYTEASYDGATATASDIQDESFEFSAGRAFDGTEGTIWRTNIDEPLPIWLAMTFPAAKTIARYGLHIFSGFADQMPYSWELQGSNDDFADYDVLDVQTAQVYTSGEVLYDIAAPGSYLAYRLWVTDKGGASQTAVGELNLYELDPAGPDVITVELDATGSYPVASGATISTYAWDVKDGVIVSGTASDAQITVEFPAGRRWVTLTVTDSNGATAVARVPVWAADKGAYAPYRARLSRRGYTGHRAGWEASFELFDADTSAFPEYSLVIYWEDEWQGAHRGSLNGYPDAEHVKFVGWLTHEDLEMQALFDTERVDAKGPLAHLQARPAFPQTVRRNTSPSRWYQVKDLDWWKTVLYLLVFHSNILELCDLEQPAFYDDYPVVRLDIEAETLFDQIEYLAQAVFAIFTADQRGRLYLRRNPHLMTAAERAAWTPLAGLTSSDLLGEGEGPRFEYLAWPQVAWLRASAIQAHATTPTALLAVAPGTLPGQGITREAANRLLAVDQADLNARSGMLYAYHQARRNGARVARRGLLPLAHRGDVIDPAWQRPVTLTLAASLNRRGIAFDNARMVPLAVDILYDHEAGHSREQLEVEEETQGAAATTEQVPTETIHDLPPLDDWEPMPIVVPEPKPVAPGDMGRAYALTRTELRVTENLSAVTPDWTQIWTPPAGLFRHFLLDLGDPLNKAMVVMSDDDVANETYIYELTNLASGSPTATLKQTLAHPAGAAKLVNTVQWFDVWFLAVEDRNKNVHVYHTHDRWDTMTTVLNAGRREGNNTAVFAVSSNAASQSSGNVYVGHYASNNVSWLRRSTDYGHSFSNFYQFPSGSLPKGIWVPWLGNENDQFIYCIWGSRLWKSSDRGLTFSQVGLDEAGRNGGSQFYNPISYTLDPQGLYYTAGYASTATVVRSLDGGETSDVRSYVAVPAGGYINLGGWPFEPYDGVIMNNANQLLVSIDGGATWSDKGWPGGSNYIWTIPVWVAA